MAKGIVLMAGTDDEEGKRFDSDHDAVLLYKHLKSEGCDLAKRKQGFKMTDKDGGRLGFCVPRKEGYVVYLTTITPDSAVLDGMSMEITKGASNLAVAANLGTPEKALSTLRKVYAAKAAADEAEAASKPKKEKKAKAEKPAKDKKTKADKPTKKEKKRGKKAKNIEEIASTVRRKKRKNKKVKAEEVEAEAA